jgi:putative inorganic carbon (HCO3(-)) transporter
MSSSPLPPSALFAPGAGSPSRVLRHTELITTVGLILYAGATPFSIALSQGGLCLAALGWLGRAVLAGRWPLRRTPLDLPFFAYVAAELLSAALSVDPRGAFIFSRRLLLVLMIYLVGSHLRTSRAVALILTPLFAVTTLLSAAAVVRYLRGPGGLEERIRFTQIYMTTAGILMMAICLGAGILLWGSRGRYRWLLAPAVTVMVVCVVFTYTRGVWLGLMGAGAAMFPYHRRRLAILVGAVLVTSWILSPPALRQRALSSFDPSHPRNVERVHMWSTGMKIWLDYPLTGVGDIGTAEIYREYMPTGAREVAGHFHSNPVHLAVTVGALGLAAVGWLFWRVLRMEITLCRRLRGQRTLALGLVKGSLGALVAFHVEGLFEWNFGDAEVVMLLWFTVGLVFAAARLAGVTPDPSPPSLWEGRCGLTRIPQATDSGETRASGERSFSCEA